MTKPERELIEEKFSGLHAAIVAMQDLQKLKDQQIIDKLNETIALQKITNGRVTKLELNEKEHFTSCPNVKLIKNIENNTRFWAFFNTPTKIIIFFGLVIIIVAIVNNPTIWGYIEKLIKLL